MYGIFTELGTCPVWVCFAVMLPPPALLNESRETTEADGIACGIVGRLRKGQDSSCGRKLAPCGDVPTLPSGHLCQSCLVVIQALTGLPIKYGPTVNPEGSSKPMGLRLPSFIFSRSSFLISLSSQHPAMRSALFLLANSLQRIHEAVFPSFLFSHVTSHYLGGRCHCRDLINVI